MHYTETNKINQIKQISKITHNNYGRKIYSTCARFLYTFDFYANLFSHVYLSGLSISIGMPNGLRLVITRLI